MRTYLRALSSLLLVLTLGTSISTAQVLSLDGDDGGSLGVGDTTVTVGGESDSDSLVDVDADDDRTDVDVLPGSAGSDSEVIVRLFGNSGGGTTATVGTTQGSTNPADAEVNLFGDGSEGSAAVDIFGPGSDGGDGANGSGGTGGNGSAAGAGAGGAAAGATATRLATTADGCFAPDQAHIANLLGRNGNSAASAISQVSDANVVSVDICPNSRARLSQAVAADSSSSSIRGAVSANAHIVQALNNVGKSPADVLSVDTNGSNATVYVF